MGVLLNAHDSGTGQMYDAATGRLIWETVLMPGSPDTIIQTYAFDRDGTEMLYSNGGLYVLDPTTGAVRSVPLDTPCPELGPMVIADGAKRIDVDHPLIVFATTADGECTGSRIAVARLDSSTGAVDVLAEFSSARISIGDATTEADGHLLAFRDVDQIVVFDLATGESQAYGASTVGSFPFLSPDGTLLATIGNDRNDVWDLPGDALLWSFPGRMGYMTFSSDGRLILGAPLDGPARIWDARSGEELVVLHGVGWAQLSDDGLRALYERTILNTGANGEVGAFDFPRQPRYCLDDLEVTPDRLAVRWGCERTGGIAGVFDRASGELLYSVKAAGDDIGLSPDGRFLAAQEWPGADLIGRVRVYDTANGGSVLMEGLCTWSGITETGPGCRDHPDLPFMAWVTSLTFSPDGSKLVAGMSEPGERGPPPMVVWDTQTGEIVYGSAEDLLAPLPLMTPDGDRILVWTHDGEPVMLETAGWTRADGPPADLNIYDPMAFTPDGRHLVSSESDGLRVVDTATWETIRHVSDLDAETPVAVDPSGTLIASGRDSGIVKIYSFETLHMLQKVPVGEPIRNLAWLSEHHVLVTPLSGPGIVVTTDVDELLEVARARVTRSFTASECAAYHIDPCP
jgi:WD40 repeat protein